MKKAFDAAGARAALAMTTIMLAGAGSLPGQAQRPTLGLPGTPGGAPTEAAKVDGPRIKFAETRFDFGKIKSSTPVRHDYVVTNVGTAVLNITAVQPGCPGCTKAVTWDREIQPGQTGRIQIEFNPAGFSGTQSKSVTVTCNDVTQPTHYLQFQATIWQPIEVQPGYVYFMAVEGEGTNENKTVRITSNLEEPLILQTPQTDNPAFKLALKTVRPDKEYELHVSHVPPASNAVPQGLITIATSSTNVPQLKVSAVAMPQPAMVVSPPQITLPAVSPATGHRHTQMIRNNSSQPLKITEATVNAEGVNVQITEPQPGKLFMVNVSFPAGYTLPKGSPVALTLKTSSGRRPVVTVPISQSTAPPGIGAPPLVQPPPGLK